MEVSQYALAWMLCCSAICGACFGFVYDLMRWIRPWSPRVMTASALTLAHRLQLPQRLRMTRACREPTTPRRGRWLLHALLFGEDVLFCVSCAVALTVLLYATNDGQMRLSVLALFGIGWGVYTVTVGLLIRRLSSYLYVLVRALIAWGVAVLMLPFRLLVRYVKRLTAPLGARLTAWIVRCRAKIKETANQRRMRCQAKKHSNEGENVGSNSKPPNSNHYFSTGRKGRTPTA